MSRRIERINELLRQEISSLLTMQIKDPRLNNVITITRVVTTSDLRNARVFLSAMGDEETKQDVLTGIRSAATFIRRELRSRVNLRYIPFLSFDLDTGPQEADHILSIMDGIRNEQPSMAPLTPSVTKLRTAAALDPSTPQDTYTGPLSFPKRKV
jgi:ribosome-binding factor A